MPQGLFDRRLFRSRRADREALAVLHSDLAADGVALAFAELKDPVRDYLRRYGVEAAIGTERFFPTIGAAVAMNLEQPQTASVDGDERELDEQPG